MITKEYKEYLLTMTKEELIGHVLDVSLDYDGNNTVESLKRLIDEMRVCLKLFGSVKPE